MREKLDGWVFDAYPEPGGMRLWVATARGCVALHDPWSVPFHLGGQGEAVARALAYLAARPYPVATRPVERMELFSGKDKSVLEVRLPPLERDAAVKALAGLGAELYGADLHLGQAYHYDRGHFPLARCAFEAEGGVLSSWELRDDPWAADYELPPLRTAHLALSGSEVAGRVDPNHAARGRLSLSMDGRCCELEGPPEEQLESLARRLKDWDPDVITSDWGDSVLLPALAGLSLRHGIALPLSRDPGKAMGGRKSPRSFHTYGRTVYQHAIRYLFGRWHLDMKNSFMLRECGTAGLFELARLAKIPVQRAARCTIGTSLSSMQLDAALRDGVLIPMDKAQAEDFRGADSLLESDKGGLVYEPETGWHEGVWEYDFVSMYPAIMVGKNISPETVNCPCCPEAPPVPGTRHRLCAKRRGLVPRVLEPLLSKRARYKAIAKAGGPGAAEAKARASAHKWALVTCFGYLGFKNARFGKIEAHECVNAWGRELLLLAKETVEARGGALLHALVDSLWILPPPGETDPEPLRREIEEAAGCPMGLEGVYRWLRFCPSRQDPEAGVPARYFGAFADGSLKVRGLSCRRRDTPPLLKTLQRELLERLARAEGLAGCRALKGELETVVEGFAARLKEGAVTAEELAITVHLSKRPEEYRHDTLTALAAKGLAASGVELHPGETLRFVIASAKDKVKDWRVRPLALLEGPLEYDPARYLELLERAAKEILEGL